MEKETIENCLICLEPLTRRVLLPCGHSPACLRCFFTYLHNYGKRNCPFCQLPVVDDPIVTDSEVSGSYSRELFHDYKHNTDFGVFYKDPAVISELESYQQFKCPMCSFKAKTFGILTKHVRTHNCVTCKICNDTQMFLPSQTQVFTHAEYKKHMKRHPKCPVCSFIAFDQSSLNEHMRDKHFRCDICAEQGKILWFASMDLLQVHFHSQHFACEDPMCVEQGFIVFATEMELQIHRMTVHNDRSTLMVDFKEEEKQKQPNFNAEHKKRILAAKKKLGSLLRKYLNDERKYNMVYSLIDKLQKNQITAEHFLNKFEEICEEHANILFCDVVAAIGNSKARAELVKTRQGIRPCPVFNVYSQPVTGDFPTIPPSNEASNNHHSPSPPPRQQKPQNGPKKKPKKIIITSF